jgi:hypothetical protein
MIGSGASWFMVFMVKETYAPAILRAKAAKKHQILDTTLATTTRKPFGRC